MKRLSLFLMAMLLIFVISSCNDKSDNIPSFSDYPTMDRLIEGGYEDLLNGDYEDANVKFRQANERDAFDIRVYDGLGWSYAYISNNDLAISSFSKLQTFGETIQEFANATAGMAIAYDAKKEYINAKSNANKCLQLQSNYSHEILETINYHDLYIVKANCYLYENKLDSMLMELKKNNSDALSTLLSDKTQIDTVQQDSMINFVTGMVRIPLKGENIAILNSVTFHEMEGYVTLSYLDYSNNEVVIFSNPIPQVGTMYELNYKKLDEYIDFQTALYQELNNQIDTYKE